MVISIVSHQLSSLHHNKSYTCFNQESWSGVNLSWHPSCWCLIIPTKIDSQTPVWLTSGLQGLGHLKGPLLLDIHTTLLVSISTLCKAAIYCSSSSRPALCQNQDKSANAKSHLEEPEAGISIPPSLVPLPLVKPKSLVCWIYNIMSFILFDVWYQFFSG